MEVDSEETVPVRVPVPDVSSSDVKADAAAAAAAAAESSDGLKKQVHEVAALQVSILAELQGIAFELSNKPGQSLQTCRYLDLHMCLDSRQGCRAGSLRC